MDKSSPFQVLNWQLKENTLEEEETSWSAFSQLGRFLSAPNHKEEDRFSLNHEGGFSEKSTYLDCQLLWNISIVIRGRERTRKKFSANQNISLTTVIISLPKNVPHGRPWQPSSAWHAGLTTGAYNSPAAKGIQSWGPGIEKAARPTLEFPQADSRSRSVVVGRGECG